MQRSHPPSGLLKPFGNLHISLLHQQKIMSSSSRMLTNAQAETASRKAYKKYVSGIYQDLKLSRRNNPPQAGRKTVLYNLKKNNQMATSKIASVRRKYTP